MSYHPTADASVHRSGVCMLHMGRCGSTVLGDLLDQHDAIRWDGEVYEEDRVGARLSHAPLELLAARLAGCDVPWYGFELKLLPNQHPRLMGLTLDRFLARARELGIERFIVLERRNHLRRIVSGAVGRAAKRWHRPAGRPLERVTVRLDIERVGLGFDEPAPLLDRLREIEAAYGSARDLLRGKPVLELSYEEDIATDPLRAHARSCRFLGLSPGAPTPRYDVTNPFPIRQIVENYEEVAALLRDTPYGWMLEDDA